MFIEFSLVPVAIRNASGRIIAIWVTARLHLGGTGHRYGQSEIEARAIQNGTAHGVIHFCDSDGARSEYPPESALRLDERCEYRAAHITQ